MSYLRNRFTDALKALGLNKDNTHTILRTDTLMNYQLKLQPILSDGYLRKLQQTHNDKDDTERSFFALKHSLSVPIVEVTNLTVQPGERHFVLWLFISSYFPLVSACTAPLGNLISLIGLVEHWRMDKGTLKTIPDPHSAFVLNILSFVLGLLGNASLLMNFSGKMRYLVTQCVSIICWIVAASLLFGAIIITNKLVIAEGSMYRRSEGFWLAVFTIGMYYLCSIVLIINFIGYKLDKYPPTFNLDKKQRLLMSYTIAFSIWQATGAIVMVQLIPGLTYGASLYYCTVSMLTIGLGDIVPESPGAKVYALIFSFIGVVIMGLIIAMIRQVVISSAGPSIFWHLIERRRLEELQKIEDKKITITVEESFARMRKLRGAVRIQQMNFSLMLTMSIFFVFWLVGALIFMFSESWDYFNAVYFCFLCLVTIGYGDYHPESPFGRTFFVMWAIAAIPLMTILISSVGDKLYEFADKVDLWATVLLSWRTYRSLFKRSETGIGEETLPEEADLEGIKEDLDLDVAIEEVEGSYTQEHPVDTRIAHLHDALNMHYQNSNLILNRVQNLKLLLFDIVEEPEKRYKLDEWSEQLRILDEDRVFEDPTYWLGDSSPLRLPIKEPNYLLMKMFVRVERDLLQMIEAQKQDIRKLHLDIGLTPVELQSSVQ